MRFMLTPIAVTLAVLFAADRAHAISVDTTTAGGTTFGLDFDGNVNGINIPGLGAHADLTFVSFTGSQLILDVALENTSSVTSRISVFAFDSNPDVLSGGSSGDFGTLILDSQLPNNVGAVDLCAKNAPNANNCLSGTGGPAAGETYNFTLTLNYAAGITAVDLDNFHVRYQSIDGLSEGTSGTGNVVPGIPEPNSALLFVMGGWLASLGARRS